MLNTITAEAIDELAAALEAKLGEGIGVDEAVIAVVKDSYNVNKQIVFGGDGYSDEWHAEAPRAGSTTCPRRRTRCRAWRRADRRGDVEVRRPVQARARGPLEVAVEQYITKLNIEAETTVQIARTMILPAAVRYLTDLKASELAGPRRGGRPADRRRSTRRSSRSRPPTRTRACTASTSRNT